MSQGGFVTLVGYVAQDPNIRTTATGKQLTKVRVGTTPRYRDNETGQWRDGESSYYTITCWNKLADHVRASLHKGDPVIVKGKLRTSTFEDKNGQLKTSVEITADTMGHDLSRGPANYMRLQSRRSNVDDDQDRGEFAANPEYSGTPMDPDELLDEDAIERFGRDLEDDEIAARAAAENEDENEDDDEAGAPAVPVAPF